MFIDKIIKREIGVLVVSVVAVFVVIIGISYALFFSVDEGEEDTINIGDLKITFCADKTCNDTYENLGKIIGTKKVGGISVPSKVYPYDSYKEALKTEPYIFNIKNTGAIDAYLTIKLVEDKEYELADNYKDYVSLIANYPEYIKIVVSDCSNSLERDKVEVLTYSELNKHIIKADDYLKSNQDKTYCLWTWLDYNTPNEAQNTYFVANLDFAAEYKPNE